MFVHYDVDVNLLRIILQQSNDDNKDDANSSADLSTTIDSLNTENLSDAQLKQKLTDLLPI